MTDIYASVFQLLDTTVANNRCLASSEAHVQRALSHFRHDSDDNEARDQLERISVLLHRLSLANIGSDDATRQAVLHRLKASAMVWMKRLPMQ